jgi:hypothetical protein
LSRQGTDLCGWENEDQSLFTQSLPQELSCDDQCLHSNRTTLPGQLWLSFVGARISPSETYIRPFIGLFERFDVLKQLVVAETD